LIFLELINEEIYRGHFSNASRTSVFPSSLFDNRATHKRYASIYIAVNKEMRMYDIIGDRVLFFVALSGSVI